MLRGEESSVPSGPPIFTSLDVAPRIALRRSSVAAAKMPRIRFYNRRSRHEHPSETPLSETARRAPWETRRRSTSRPPSARGFRLLASSGAGPPCGHPTSDGCALDGALPASGSSTTSFFRGSELPYVARAACGRRKCPGFFGRRYLCRFEPSDTSCSAPDKDPRRGAPFFRSLDPASAGARQCADFYVIEMSSIAGDRRTGPFGLLRGALSPLACGGSRCTFSSGFGEPRLDPCSPAIRVRLQGRVRSHDFCKCMFPRARPRTTSNIPNDRNPSLGPLPESVESCLSPGQPPELHRDRGRETPCLDSPHRDCSRQRLCPDLARSGYLLSRGPSLSLSGATWEKNGTAGAAQTCTVRAARGSCGAQPPRRGRTFTNPRYLLPAGRFALRNGRDCRCSPE